MDQATGEADRFATPAGQASGLAGLVATRWPPYLAARIALLAGRALGGPLRLGSVVLAARYQDVLEALERDLDFVIQPVNDARFREIGYHFILGMDRSGELIRERSPLYAALARVDFDHLRRAAAEDIRRLLEAAGGGPLDIVAGYARPVAAATARRLFGIAPDSDPDSHQEFMDVARAIFNHCFLNLTGDARVKARAVAAAGRLSQWFDAEMARRRRRGEFGLDMMGALMAAGVDDDLTRRTLGGMLVGSIDTTATVVAKATSVLVGDARILARARADRADLARVDGWTREALRFWPHGPLLIRQVAADTTLGQTAVRAGDRALLLTEAAMLDPDGFPDPLRLDPTRPPKAYLHFGHGLHPCAGRAINAWQIPMLMAGLLSLDPVRVSGLAWAGPFPAHLKLHFRGRP